MDGKNLAAPSEVLNHSENVLAHLVSALRPGADAKGQSPVLAAAHKLIGPFDAVIVGEDFGYTVHHRDRWIVGMQCQPNIGLLGNREDRLDEIGIVGPDIVGRVLALETLLFDLALEVVQAELPDLVPAR